MPKIIVEEHRDHFYQIPQVISDRSTLFQGKKDIWGQFFSIISNFFTFFPFFTTTTTPLQIIQFPREQIFT